MMIQVLPFLLSLLTLTGTGFSQDSVTSADSLSQLAPPILSNVDQVPEAFTPVLVTIVCEEDRSKRWISIAGGTSPRSQSMIQPDYETDAGEGSFTISLRGIDTVAYLGSRMHRGYGHYPIQYEVIYPDSHTVIIRGKTLPFDDVRCYYSFELQEYRLEFIFNDRGAPLVAQSKVDRAAQKTTNPPNQDSERVTTNHPGTSSSLGSSKSLLLNSTLIATVGVGFVLLVIGLMILGKRRRARKAAADPNFAEVLDSKSGGNKAVEAANSGEPEVLTVEMREEKIRTLMESQNVSYDEAALRIQYETMDQDNV